MSLKIFISYRRDADKYAAGRLYNRLSEHFPKDRIFMDVDAFRFGDDFVEAIEKKVSECEVLIAVIGLHWLSSKDVHDWRRPGNPEDFVRMEIGTALRRDIRVIPVLVDGALMPRSNDLPDDLKALVRWNALRISDTGFDNDCLRLVAAIEQEWWPVEAEQLERQPPLSKPPKSAPMPHPVPPPYCYSGGKPLPESSMKGLGPLQLFRDCVNRAAKLILKTPKSDEVPCVHEPLEPERVAPSYLADLLASGEFTKEPHNRVVNVREPERNPVDCTVFAPDRVERQRTALLQVFLHSPKDRKQAEVNAEKFDPDAKERGHKSLVLDAPIGTNFAFVVDVEGFEFRERKDTLLWTGKPEAATFRFDVPKGCTWGQHTGVVRIFKDGLPVGRISFQIEVVRDASNVHKRPMGKEARHYRACFCSYSSLDKVEMLKRAQGLRATGLKTFIDVMTLRPGDIWNPKILGAIDESDLFVVIWSNNARNSKWVKKETLYALKLCERRGSPDFVPIPVEGPPIPSVPRGLNARHFNDELLSLIRAAEVEAEERERKKAEQAKPEA
jgi:hypothetical protein